MELYYIGEDDCKKASCNRRQEFPDGPCPYCVEHSLQNFMEERAATVGKSDENVNGGDR